MRKMKDSGIAWIGKIPEGWGKDRFKYSGEFAKGKIPNKLNSEKKGVPYIGASEINSYEFKNYTEDSSVVFCTQNDILFLWDGANAGNVATGFKGAVSSTIVKYSLYNAKTVQRYVYYLIKYAENYFKDKVNGTTIPHMNFQYIDDIPLLLPSLSTQRKIADFLDKKCAEIDKLIELQDSMIDKLKEYKQSVITQAVTKGLDPDVPMKDSGIEWIGKIPEGWEVVKNKILFKNASIKGHGEDEVLSLYRDFGVVPKLSRDDNHNVTSLDTDSYKYVEKGDLVINKMKAWSGSLAISNYSGIVSPAYYVCKLNNEKVVNRFVHYYLRNKLIVQLYKRYSAGLRIGQWDLSIEDFLSIEIAVPNKSLQQQIADYLDKKCAEIDDLIKLKEQKIEKLKEYKKSLIYEYVTGKKEVV